MKKRTLAKSLEKDKNKKFIGKKKFVGRDEYIDLFREQLKRPQNADDTQVLAIHGEGGQGKSALSREFEGYIKNLAESKNPSALPAVGRGST